MGTAKSLRKLLSGLIARVFQPLDGAAWIAVATFVFCLVLGVTTYKLWNLYGDQIMNQRRYRLDAQSITVTPQPAWIRSNVKSTAITFGQLENASLLENDLVLQVRQAFVVQPWVKRVILVNKRFPSSVEVDLEYRRPIAMVEVPPGMFEGHDYVGLVPVDDEGVLLPPEITSEEAEKFPIIKGIDSPPVATEGNAWGDSRVASAAAIVSLLEDLWTPLQLYQIEVPPKQSTVAPVGEDYVLITKKRRQFKWGSAPGKEHSGEEPARDKVLRLRTFLQEQGPLDTFEGDDNSDLSSLIGLRYARGRDGERTN